jgi:hypothetical protein
MRPRRLLPLLAVATALGCGGDGAPPQPGGETGAGGSFGYQREQPAEELAEPLLALSYEGGLIKNPDPTPFVRVYPGGRVLIHYPAYMKLAGDYELVLSDEEVEELLSSFADREVLTLAPDALNQMAAEVRAEQGLDVPEGDHGVATVVEIHAEEFTPAEEDQPPLLDVDQRIVALELPPAEAVTAPRFSKLRAVAVGVRKLEALAERDDLQPVELAPTDAAAQPAPGTGVQR